MKTKRFLACAVALALGAWGCDGNGGTDAGTMPGTDAGPRDAGGGGGEDSGMTMMDGGGGEDSGMMMTDAGPPQTFQVRIVNNMPGLTGTTARPGGFHICLYVASGATILTSRFVTQTLGPVPFRGVSPYTSLEVIAPLDYIAAFYEPANLGDPAMCPADPNAAGAPTAALIATIPPTALEVNGRYTIITSGLLPDTFGATGGALPSICNPAAAAPTFMAACTQGSQLLLIEDDDTAPASGNTRVRVSNQVVNSTPPSGFTVCYDPSIVPNPAGDGTCVDMNPADEAVALATGLAYGMVSAYAERAEIVPTIPAAMAGGGLYVRLEDGMGCTPAFSGGRCYPILDAWPTAMPADEIQPRMADGSINTIFISGLLPPGAPFAATHGVQFFVWQDNYVAP
ncbi:MAG: hypothetical protein KF729_27530 [Sandaracinaceae bacterium]|nr:hypothetical protein [Sandaracinaceae bacterium]